jgi:hypothetical protein
VGIFTRAKPDEPQKRRRIVVLRAAGARIDLRDRESIKHLVGTKQAWQTDAWVYRDLIPELRFGAKYMANAVGRAKFIGAAVNPDGDDPIPLWKKPDDVSPDLAQAVEDELARLPFHSGSKFQGKMAENFDVAGEFWLHGYLDALGRERWEVLSVDEVQIAPDGVITLKNGKGQIRHRVDTDTEEMIRMWVQHPRYSDYADSAMRALMDVCAEIVLNGRERRAVSRSRASANGLLLVPEGMSLSQNSQDDDGGADSNSFVAELMGAMLAPINNEGDPGGVVPMVIQGNPDDLDKIRQVRLEREDSEVILAKLDNAIGRLGTGLDIPREVLSGLGDSNHWSAWQIDASTYRYHIDPRLRIIADGLTEGFLWPALMARGQFTIDEISTVQVWFDSGNLTENPNRTQDAKDAYDRAAINAKTLRDSLGFTDDDAPTDDEIFRQIAIAAKMDPISAGLILQRMLEPSKPLIFPTREQIADKTAGNVPVDDQGRPIQAGSPNAPQVTSGTVTSATPTTVGTTPTQPGAVTSSGLLGDLLALAAAAPAVGVDWHVDVSASRELMEIERNLRDRLLVAADAAMSRVLEKAGNRVKSRTNGKADLRAKLEGQDVEQFAAILGEQAVMALGLDLDKLLEGAFDVLQSKFTTWSTAGANRVASTVLRLLHLDPASPAGQQLHDRITSSMAARVDPAWQRLHSNLRSLAAKYLYTPPGTPEPGEHNGTIIPTGIIRAALADIGEPIPGSGGTTDQGTPAAGNGTPVGGLALGDTVQSAIREHGGTDIGYEWVYGITDLDREFHPHRNLDGLRFAGWSDAKLSTALDPAGAWVGPFFHPGDHNGCMCDYVPVYAIPQYKSDLEKLQENSQNANDDRALADLDRAAGRHNTTAALAAAERERIQALQQRFIDRN